MLDDHSIFYNIFYRNRVMYYLSYLIKCIMYIEDRLLVIERVFLRKNIQRNMFFFCVFFCEVYFLGQNASCGKFVFSNVTYKEETFYQKRSELDFRCESGRKGKNRYPSWRYL